MTTRRAFLGGMLAALARPDLFADAPAPDDPIEMLYSRRLAFAQGQPLVTVRIAEAQKQMALEPRGPLAAAARTSDGKLAPALEGGEPGRWTVRLVEGTAGAGAAWAELEQLRYADRPGLARARAQWEMRGIKTRVAVVGQVYGIAGHAVDTRRYAVLADGDGTEAGAQRDAARIAAAVEGIRPQIHRELASLPRGRIELVDPGGVARTAADSALELRAPGGISVVDVEFGMGYASHGFETRTYPGKVYAAVDGSGALALVAAVPMERLVKGVVPSEIFPTAHLEALKAQAVTARGEVLAKVGARHLGDPYLLCAEQHCQVYRGASAETPATDAAVDATRGEALFARVESLEGLPARGAVSRLVDSVYSAVCGGYTEDNDVVWGGPPDPSLRGRPDFDPSDPSLARFAHGVGASLVSQFVHREDVPSYCALSGLAKPGKLRWRRVLTQEEVDAACAHLGVGRVRALVVEGRGVSGRARSLRVEGESGKATVAPELAIRRLFGNLNSAMIVVERQDSSWAFTGGGWGHGSGMCQLGAIGRAQRGSDYRRILAWYYSGARPEKIY
jgi:SpoIID/LytB domain protein